MKNDTLFLRKRGTKPLPDLGSVAEYCQTPSIVLHFKERIIDGSSTNNNSLYLSSFLCSFLSVRVVGSTYVSWYSWLKMTEFEFEMNSLFSVRLCVYKSMRKIPTAHPFNLINYSASLPSVGKCLYALAPLWASLGRPRQADFCLILHIYQEYPCISIVVINI